MFVIFVSVRTIGAATVRRALRFGVRRNTRIVEPMYVLPVTRGALNNWLTAMLANFLGHYSVPLMNAA